MVGTDHSLGSRKTQIGRHLPNLDIPPVHQKVYDTHPRQQFRLHPFGDIVLLAALLGEAGEKTVDELVGDAGELAG